MRAVPAKTERIETTVSGLPHHLDHIAVRVSAEAEAVRADIQRQQHDSADVARVLAELRAELRSQLETSRRDSAQHLDSVRAELGGRLDRLGEHERGTTEAMLAEIRTVRAEADAHGARLRDHLAAVQHLERVGIEASLSVGRDVAFRSLCADIGAVSDRVDGLSVMVITWNHAGWLPEALDSALAALAALPPGLAGKVLVLDDGSSDETALVLDPLAADQRFRLVRSPSNIGLSRARNVLLSICPTRHAVILDADNRILTDGTKALYDVARWLHPAITWGHVIASTDGGADWQAYAYAPSAQSLRTSYCFDSMCVIDVEAVLRLGGYSTDPQLAGVADDFELLLRCLRRGELVSFVPAVLGLYRISPHRHSAQVADQRLIEARLTRSYLYDDLDLDRCCIVGAHADTGVLWASAGAVDHLGIAPAPVPVPDATGSEGPRILMIVPGGVGNIGDDAITDAAVERVRRICPEARIELVSDRGVPDLSGPPVPWSGTVLELSGSLPDSVLPFATFDAAIFAGGGNLATAFGEELLRPRVALCLALAQLGVPVMWSGQGIGPCSDDELDLIGEAIQASVAFGCRDAASLASFPAHVGDRMSLTGDDALGRPSATDAETDAVLRDASVGGEGYLVAHLRRADYVGAHEMQDLIRAIDDLAAERGVTVLGLCVNDNEPTEAQVFLSESRAEPRRAPWRMVEATRRPALVRGLVARAEAVVSHSYHVALWALEAGTPTLLVTASDYYRAKARGLAELAGFDGSIALEPDDDLAGLDDRLDDVAMWLKSSQLPDVTAHVEQWWDGQLRALL